MAQPVVINTSSSSSPSTTNESPYKKGMLWAVLTSFFLMWVFFYVVLQVFAPSVVRKGDGAFRGVDDADCCRPVDNGKCFVGALVITIVLMLVLWLIVASVK